MKPIALAFKNYEVNPFTNRGSGELMIVHQCVNCGKISPNRISGDDNEYQVLSLLKESFNIDNLLKSASSQATLMVKIENLGINIITPENQEDVLISLFGINYKSLVK